MGTFGAGSVPFLFFAGVRWIRLTCIPRDTGALFSRIKNSRGTPQRFTAVVDNRTSWKNALAGKGAVPFSDAWRHVSPRQKMPQTVASGRYGFPQGIFLRVERVYARRVSARLLNAVRCGGSAKPAPCLPYRAVHGVPDPGDHTGQSAWKYALQSVPDIPGG